jgi:cold-inducible RNA-binding protein
MLRLFVGNIPTACTEIELSDWFAQHGHDVATAEVMRDRATGYSRGFAFVELRDTSNLEETVERLQGQLLSGRVLTINAATPRNSGRLHSQTA